MRTFLTGVVLTAAVLVMQAAPAHADHPRFAALVDSWYHRYLGRHADPIGMSDHTRALRQGTPIDIVEASILSSREYWMRSGATPEGYVARLYRDVLGRQPSHHEFHRNLHRLRVEGRDGVALHVLSLRGITPVAVAPVQVFQPQPPVVYSPGPVIVRPAPVIVDPIVRPTFSFRFNFR